MKKIYERLQETVYAETLANGLQVYLVPKPGFKQTFGLFTANYGSIDNIFVPLGETAKREVPDGIAHFLEHQMFAEPDGDAAEKFARLGAYSNAFTSFTRTSYLFSATEYIRENLLTLVDFVQQPYFTEKGVAKEKGIIEQEIKMYDDDPSWRIFFGLLENLYPKHPLHLDIAGTVASIKEITPAELLTCYRTFYHPSNMSLVVVGAIDPAETLRWIRENQAQKSFAPAETLQRFFPEETLADLQPKRVEEADVVRPKLLLGIKGSAPLPEAAAERFVYHRSLNLLLEMLLGETSEKYQELYEEGLIDDSFSLEVDLERELYFGILGGDTDQPEKLDEVLTKVLSEWKDSPALTEKRFELLKRRMIGKYLQSLNSLEFIATRLSQKDAHTVSVFEEVPLIEKLTLADVLKSGESFLRPEAFSRFVLKPVKNA